MGLPLGVLFLGFEYFLDVGVLIWGGKALDCIIEGLGAAVAEAVGVGGFLVFGDEGLTCSGFYLLSDHFTQGRPRHGRSGSGRNISNGALKVAFASISAMAEIFHTIDQDVNQVT
ncbi:hypothetical protein RHMOL_Rhmol13G0215100 [Rhododendron molle]|uniref:Uncharacterized protein n=1 Tax=Rhododendron molle TaxID=49168 RepID=A0ACC0LA11_RHOML|nr:hypothetical protein RHMOL_Rhmol13G0215100 [Rhododendron molle]